MQVVDLYNHYDAHKMVECVCMCVSMYVITLLYGCLVH